MLSSNSPINIYALGGLGEVGKNTYCIESEKNLIMIDAGVRFPEATLPGIDYVIPDYTYLKNNRSKIKALFITHGHEDHIGGIPFLLRSVYIPVIYAPRLAAALIRHKMEDYRIKEPVKIVEFDDTTTVNIGDEMNISFFRVTHSIPDAYGICVDTPQGRIVESGDFKIDLTPVGPNFQMDKLTQLGNEGVDVLMADSTNAEIEGYTPSETAVRSGVADIFDKAPGRVIVSTFSSNINRIQQVVEEAVLHERKICVVGRSMINVMEIAREYGYIKIPDSSMIEDIDVRNYRANQICILCTGSQGEQNAALNRIVSGDHKTINIMPGDTVVFSSNPIPGNGAFIDKLVNKLVKLGADVKQNSLAFSLHSSGHPSKQELRLLQRLVRPKYFFPIHGEFRMLRLHGELAETLGMPKQNIFICDNGEMLTLKNHTLVKEGKIPAEDIYLDGKSIDGIPSSVIKERDKLRTDGLIYILLTVDSKTTTFTQEPRIFSRGFAADEASHIVRHAKIRADEACEKLSGAKVTFAEIRSTIIEDVSAYIYRKTARTPMVVPVIMDEQKKL